MKSLLLLFQGPGCRKLHLQWMDAVVSWGKSPDEQMGEDRRTVCQQLCSSTHIPLTSPRCKQGWIVLPVSNLLDSYLCTTWRYVSPEFFTMTISFFTYKTELMLCRSQCNWCVCTALAPCLNMVYAKWQKCFHGDFRV